MTKKLQLFLILCFGLVCFVFLAMFDFGKTDNMHDDVCVSPIKNDSTNVLSNRIQPPLTKYVEIIDTCDLRIYIPRYSRIDLVCENIPSKEDQSVIMIAGAAFTGECIEDFNHFNIAGDHVTNGKRERGYKCKRNNGAFVWYNDSAIFLQQYSFIKTIHRLLIQQQNMAVVDSHKK